MMKRFNSDNVKASSHLAVTPLKTKAANARAYKQALEWADGKPVVKVRDYLAPVKASYVPKGFGRKRHPLQCKLSHEKRLVVLERAERNAAFHAELKAEVARIVASR